MQETGDFDGDGIIGIEDAQNILNVYTKTLAGSEVELTDGQKKSCDINSDGTVDVADAQLVLNYYVKNTLSNTPTTWEQLLGK